MINFIIAQIISIISGIFLITGIRSKEKKKFLILNSMSNLAGFLSLILLSAYSACIGPIVLTIQAIISYIYENKGKKNIINIEQEPKTETTEVADKEPNNNYTYDNTYTYDENINEEITNQNRHNYTRRKKRF